ncbi:phosphotransferase family protein [Halorubraceae archaeon YAN]|nr:phosphotransferase family protein [Halorubraceae archaeon YAN]
MTEYIHRIINKEHLSDYLEARFGSSSVYKIHYHNRGHSNETLFIRWGDRNLVLRRPPPGEVATSAHDVLREYRVISALQPTNVSVPPTVASCDDHSIIGSDFYMMEAVEGNVIRNDLPDHFTKNTHKRQIGLEVIDRLAQIHDVDYEAIGLSDFGSPEGFTKRQIDRWTKQFEWATKITDSERNISQINFVSKWLMQNAPETHSHALVHGDYKLDNVMFGPQVPPQIVSIFDWELSTLGDPLTDLGWLLSFWWDKGDPDPPNSINSLYPDFTRQNMYATRHELIDRYEQKTGMIFTNQRFYRVLAVYKLAALGEMFFRRHLEGNSDDPLYPKMENGVPDLITRAIRIIDGEEPL